VWKKVRLYQLRMAAHVIICGLLLCWRKARKHLIAETTPPPKTILLLFTEIYSSTLDSCSNCRMWFCYVTRTGGHPFYKNI
jgi:hypothetical protein